ncbi:DUF2637 domain-containing protein [Streptomyces sp. NPDC023838]|uniref:DUF2637 domain-containing protein n=1 Tax=Streptomyces sp. NPDC023838 TaxID=3154325 RepID=UPI0033E9225E
MNQTLTGNQHPATQGAKAGAAPETNGAAPVATPAAPGSPEAIPPSPRKGEAGAATAAGSAVSRAGAGGHLAPAAVAAPEPPAETREARWIGRALLAVALVCMPTVGAIGFAASYATLRQFARDVGFGGLAPWFPIGIDASIVGLLALDLVMVRARRPMPLLRFAAHAMTVVTVVFNASDGLTPGDDQSVWQALADKPLHAASHGVMPILFVLGVEALRHLLKKAGALNTADRIPLHRWTLAPVSTGRLYRRMRLAGVRSYAQMIEREQALEGYTVWLKQQHGGSLKAASEIELLPLTMAPRGFSVEQALALPEQWEREAAEREEQKRARQRLEAERQRQAARREAEQDKEARIAAIEDAADIEAAQHGATARTATAQSEAATAARLAEQRRFQAERAATAEEEALLSAEAAAALRRAETDQAAAADEKLRTARKLAEAERLEAETQELARRAAEDRLRTLEAETRAAQREDDVARARARAAALEAAAEAADDYARLTPRQRNARRVARMLLAAHPADVAPADIDPERVPLAEIQERLTVARTTAGEIRQEARQLITDGYTIDLATHEMAVEHGAAR